MDKNDKQSLRKDLLKILLLLSRQDLREVYAGDESDELLLEDLFYHWKEKFTLNKEPVELFFTVSEKGALSSVQEVFEEIFYGLFQGVDIQAVIHKDSFDKLSKVAEKALVVFSQKEIFLYYKEFFEDSEDI